MSTPTSSYAAHDADVATSQPAGPDRAPTDAERQYLHARVADLEESVEKVRAKVKGDQEALKSLQAELAEARKAAKS